MRRLIAAAAVFAPGVAWAEGHATEFVMRRDGAWIVNFVILFSGILWLMFRLIIPALKKRTEELSAAMERSEQAKKDARQYLLEIESKVKGFEAEAARMKREAEEQGKELKAKAMAEAEIVVKRMMEHARAEIENEYLKAQNRLRKEAIEMSTALAGELLVKNYNESDQRNSVNDYLKKVGERR